jgi:hypothetical protein
MLLLIEKLLDVILFKFIFPQGPGALTWILSITVFRRYLDRMIFLSADVGIEPRIVT